MAKKETDSKFPSKHLSIRLNNYNYCELMDLKQHTHIKSLAKIINLLLQDEFQHPIPLTDQKLINCKDKLIQFNESVGKLDQDLNRIGNNWNQMNHHLNTIDWDVEAPYFVKPNNHGDVSLFMAYKVMLKLYTNMGILDYRIQHIDKEVTKLWQSLM